MDLPQDQTVPTMREVTKDMFRAETLCTLRELFSGECLTLDGQASAEAITVPLPLLVCLQKDTLSRCCTPPGACYVIQMQSRYAIGCFFARFLRRLLNHESLNTP